MGNPGPSIDIDLPATPGRDFNPYKSAVLIIVMVLTAICWLADGSRYFVTTLLTEIEDKDQFEVNWEFASHFDKFSITKNGEWTYHDVWRTRNKPKLPSRSPDEFPKLNNSLISSKDLLNSQRNNTEDKLDQLLIYNRVDKCGSGTLKSIISRLSSKVNHFNFAFWRNGKISFTLNEERNLVRKVDRQLKTLPNLALMMNLNYIPFEEHPKITSLRPIWVNMVRDPVERFVSKFYFTRTLVGIEERRKQWLKQGVLKEWVDRSFEDCVFEGDPECRFEEDGTVFRSHQLTHFCGDSLECRVLGSPRALQQAKLNVEKAYSVVGVLEEFPLSLKLFQAYVPRFFAGAWKNYQENRVTRHKTQHPRPSEAALARLRRGMGKEVEFYQFVKQRLFAQKKAAGL